MGTSAQTPQLSNEDMAALHETWSQLQAAGDPRAEKLRQFIVAQGNSILNPDDNRGTLSKAWDWANKGLISKDTIVRALSGRTPEELQQETEPSQWDTPVQAAGKAWLRGATQDAAGTASSLTSPLSVGILATGGAGQAAKAVEAAGATGKALTAAKAVKVGSQAVGTAASVGFAAKGGQAMNDAAQGEMTPEKTQELLQGGAMLTGGGAGAMEGAGLVGLTPGMRQHLAEAAPELYRSALKPTTVPSKQANVTAAIQTGLNEGIPVSKAGIEKLGNLIDDVNQKIADQIQANKNTTINKFSVASRLSGTAKKFAVQVNPTSDLNAISDAGNEFLETTPNKLSAPDAQALKVGTYQQLRGKYGQLSSASVEAQKALARGIKEEIATAIPEIGKLNARDSQFLNLDPILERAVARISNHDVGGIGTPLAVGAAKAATGSNAAAMAAGAIKAVVDNPNVKSRLAIAMNKASKGAVSLPAANARLAAYSAALANSANTAPRDDQESAPPSQ